MTTWFIPRADVPVPPSGGSSGLSFVPAGRSLASLGVTPPSITGGLDRLIDPVTKDYVRTDTGEWAETQDSRTIMLIAMSVELGASPFDPDDGTTINQQRRAGGTLRPEFLQAEAVRVGARLAALGVLSDLEVQVRDAEGNVLVDSAGIAVVKMRWRDLASGSPIDAAFAVR